MATTYLPKLLAISTLFILINFIFSVQPETTPVDKTALLKNRELPVFLNLSNVDRFGLLPIDGKFKCSVLTLLYRIGQATYANRPELQRFRAEMQSVIRNCNRGEFRLADFFQTLMFPGTLWCGPNNIAENYHNLGLLNETDACCRDHDFCDDIIQPGRTKYNLLNTYVATRLHCKCDEALKKCLKNVRSLVSDIVGSIFFSWQEARCFDYNYPTNGCLQWRWRKARPYCVKYNFNTEEPKKWQWFDEEPYF